MYLAGSAGLALYLGHRPVRNLDFMTAGNRLLPSDRRALLQELLDLDSKIGVETARDGMLFARGGDGTALKFFYYPYPLIDPEEVIAGVPLASAIDLALMKLGAIISRGTKRDFVDFFLVTRHLPLVEVLERSPDKFGHVHDFPLQALKGLADFSLTDGEPLPRLLERVDWRELRASLEAEVRALARTRLGLTPQGKAE